MPSTPPAARNNLSDVVFSGFMAFSESPTAQTPITGGTITPGEVSGVIIRLTPAGAITAVVMDPGVIEGQIAILRNESVAASSITFDIAGNSHVANGVSTVIPGLTSKMLCWDAANALWSPVI